MFRATPQFYNGKVISVEPPNFMELQVVATQPNVKGNTVSGAWKHRFFAIFLVSEMLYVARRRLRGTCLGSAWVNVIRHS